MQPETDGHRRTCVICRTHTPNAAVATLLIVPGILTDRCVLAVDDAVGLLLPTRDRIETRLASHDTPPPRS